MTNPVFQSITFTTPPNWGQYVTGEDTLEYLYRELQSIISTGTYLYSQKISNYQQRNIFAAAITAQPPASYPIKGFGGLTGANFRGDATSGTKVAGQAFIPNAIPGGYTT